MVNKFFYRLRHSKIGRKYIANIYKFCCETLGLNKIASAVSEEESRNSYVFFTENQTRIDNNMRLLADELSKETYRVVIEARKTGNLKSLQSVKCREKEYFLKGILELQNDEIFVDCGAFNGDTERELIKQAKKQHVNIKRIYGFEPAELSYNDYCDWAKGIKNVDIIPQNFGTWDRQTILYFSDNTGVGARISENTTTFSIKTITIDEVVKDDRVTFIKMDVEGSELNSLKGAKNTILNNKPKLAICLYHSDEDILRLIEYIYSIVPDYKMYVRHYGDGNFDTILYCI